jgi:DNA-binding CsgD family transcriptional regulator
MRVILVGSPRDRARLRERAGALEIAGEADNLTDARALADGVDAFLVAHDTGVSRDDDVLIEALTDRETEVLELLADGLSNKAIGARLGISDQTVKFHVASIAGKLGARNRTEAVRLAARRGLLSL